MDLFLVLDPRTNGLQKRSAVGPGQQLRLVDRTAVQFRFFVAPTAVHNSNVEPAEFLTVVRETVANHGHWMNVLSDSASAWDSVVGIGMNQHFANCQDIAVEPDTA